MLYIIMTLQAQYDVRKPVNDAMIRAISQGDMNVFHELYDTVSKNVYSFALSITQNRQDAEDVLQETFLKIYRNSAAYVPNGKPMAWILTIARNLALSRMREKSKFSEHDDNYKSDIDFGFVADTENKILLEALFTVLNDDEKQILILHAVSGLKHRETATLLQLPLNTVISKYNRAIKKLRNATKGR